MWWRVGAVLGMTVLWVGLACTPQLDDDDDDSSSPTPTSTSEPGGPEILSFSATADEITEGDTITFTAIVTDEDGVDDLVGGQLISEETSAVYGPFTSQGEGTFSITLSWADLDAVVPIDFSGANIPRTLTAEFFDTEGLRGATGFVLTLSCARGLGASDGLCVDVHSGTYIVDTLILTTNDCGLNTEGYEGGSLSVTVNANSMDTFGVTLNSTGNATFGYANSGSNDYTGDGINCVLGVDETLDATITGYDAFDITHEFTFDQDAGDACLQLLTDNGYEAMALPCTTQYTLKTSM